MAMQFLGKEESVGSIPTLGTRILMKLLILDDSDYEKLEVIDTDGKKVDLDTSQIWLIYDNRGIDVTIELQYTMIPEGYLQKGNNA